VNKLETRLFKKERYLHAFNFYVSQSNPRLYNSGVLRDSNDQHPPIIPGDTNVSNERSRSVSMLSPSEKVGVKESGKVNASTGRPKSKQRKALLPPKS